jgi:hypothetical protein
LASEIGAEFQYNPYNDDSFFTNDLREQYFINIPIPILDNALIFCDPDIGIETGTKNYMKTKGLDKYIFWDELRSLVSRATSGSGLVVYQHLQFNKNKHSEDIRIKAETLMDVCGFSTVSSVYDGQICFFIGSKSNNTSGKMTDILRGYVQKHNGLELFEFGNERCPEMGDRFSNTASIWEGNKRLIDLTSTKVILGFTAAFSLGGAIFSSAITYDGHPVSIILGLLAGVCMWSAYKVGSHINSINREIKFLESEGKISSPILDFCVTERLIKIIFT